MGGGTAPRPSTVIDFVDEESGQRTPERFNSDLRIGAGFVLSIGNDDERGRKPGDYVISEKQLREEEHTLYTYYEAVRRH